MKRYVNNNMCSSARCCGNKCCLRRLIEWFRRCIVTFCGLFGLCANPNRTRRSSIELQDRESYVYNDANINDPAETTNYDEIQVIPSSKNDEVNTEEEVNCKGCGCKLTENGDCVFCAFIHKDCYFESLNEELRPDAYKKQGENTENDREFAPSFRPSSKYNKTSESDTTDDITYPYEAIRDAIKELRECCCRCGTSDTEQLPASPDTTPKENLERPVNQSSSDSCGYWHLCCGSLGSNSSNSEDSLDEWKSQIFFTPALPSTSSQYGTEPPMIKVTPASPSPPKSPSVVLVPPPAPKSPSEVPVPPKKRPSVLSLTLPHPRTRPSSAIDFNSPTLSLAPEVSSPQFSARRYSSNPLLSQTYTPQVSPTIVPQQMRSQETFRWPATVKVIRTNQPPFTHVYPVPQQWAMNPWMAPLSPRMLPLSPMMVPVSRWMAPVSLGMAPMSPWMASMSPMMAPMSPWMAPMSPMMAPMSPRMAPLSSRMAPPSPRMAPLSPRMVPMNPRMAPQSPRMAPLSPRMAPPSPRMAPLSPRMAPLSPRMAPMSPRMAPQSPRMAPPSPRMAPQSLRMAPQSPRMAPQSPRMAPLSPRMAPPSPRMAPMSPRMVPMSPRMAPMSPRLIPLSPRMAHLPPRQRFPHIPHERTFSSLPTKMNCPCFLNECFHECRNPWVYRDSVIRRKSAADATSRTRTAAERPHIPHEKTLSAFQTKTNCPCFLNKCFHEFGNPWVYRYSVIRRKSAADATARTRTAAERPHIPHEKALSAFQTKTNCPCFLNKCFHEFGNPWVYRDSVIRRKSAADATARTRTTAERPRILHEREFSEFPAKMNYPCFLNECFHEFGNPWVYRDSVIRRMSAADASARTRTAAERPLRKNRLYSF